MPDDAYSFSQTRVRLEEIVTQVRKKDVSLEKSLDLLEEGVRLANQCTELIDHADWGADTPESAAVASAAVAAEGNESPPAEGSVDGVVNTVGDETLQPRDESADDAATAPDDERS